MLLNAEDCVDPSALFLQDFLHCDLVYFILAAFPFKKKKSNQLYFIGLLAQKSKLLISEIFLFEMLKSLL